MFLFRSHKTLSHKQSSVIGFVLALMSILSTAVLVYMIPIVMVWLYTNAVFHLDILLGAFSLTIFLGVQGLLLFGFPLFYARDKKSHMTGFQILIYELMWLFVIMLVIILLSIFLGSGNVDPYGLDGLLY